jgi:hypothetical protein
MEKYIGIDLHRNRFTSCIRLESGQTYLSEWGLGGSGAVCEEAATLGRSGRRDHGQHQIVLQRGAEHVARVVVVNANRFRVIHQSTASLSSA